MNWTSILKLAYRVAAVMMESAAHERAPGWSVGGATDPVTCDGCGAEPWTIRWGAIRVGQELDGFYSQATTDGEPRLLCRTCWYLALGTDDPLRPQPVRY